MGKGFKKAVGGIGKVVGKGLKIASPFAALIPGVGPLAALGLGAAGRGIGRALSGQNTFGNGGLGDIVKTGALAGAGGLATGGQGFKGLGNIGSNLSKAGKSGVFKTIGKTFTNPSGGVDLGKVAGVGMAGAQLFGQRAQRQSAQNRLGAEDQLRNQVLERLLARPNYDFTGGP